VSLPATPAVEMPYGRKRRSKLATTLALDPEMMLLDEPRAGMDTEDIDKIAALIKRISGEIHDPDGRTQSERRCQLSDIITVLTRVTCWPKAIMPICPRTSASRKPIWGRHADLKMAGAAATKSATVPAQARRCCRFKISKPVRRVSYPSRDRFQW